MQRSYVDKPFQFSGSAKGLTCHTVSSDTLPQAFVLLREVTHPGLDSCGRQGLHTWIISHCRESNRCSSEHRAAQGRPSLVWKAQSTEEGAAEGGREAGPTIHTLDMWHTYLHSLDSEVYGSEQSLCWLAI